MKKGKIGLTGKIVLGGMTAALVPVICVMVLATTKSSNNIEALYKDQVAVTSTGLADMVQMTLSQDSNMLKELLTSDKLLETAARVARDGTGDSAEQIEGLQRRLARTQKQVGQNYEVIMLADAAGTIYADSDNGSYRGVQIGERGYFKEAKSGKTSVGDVILSRKTGEPVAPLAAPVLSDKGELLGVLGVVLKVDYLIEKVAGVKLGDTGYAYIVDKTGTVIIHPNKDLILKTNITTCQGMENIREKMLRGESGVEYYSFKGEDKVGGYAPVPIAGWSVAATQPLKEMKAPIQAMKREIALLSGLLIAGILALVLVFGRRMSAPIVKAVEGISEASEQVASAAMQLSSASGQLAEGAAEQAASLEETSSALEEMASMTQQNADNARQCRCVMEEADAIIGAVHQHMNGMEQAMAKISGSSEETVKIIRTIDEIAFQTNLLALNAAVEAARAGEAGAGFAVVADEVRNLALRAADAAKTTNALIENTIKAVREGTELNKLTREAFDKNVTISKKAGELVGEIAVASQEQAQGIQQISTAMDEMDKVTQQTSANAEESASVSEELSSQASHMRIFVVGLETVVGARQNDGGGILLRLDDKQNSRPAIKQDAGQIPSRTAGGRTGGKSGVELDLLPRGSREATPKHVIPFDDDMKGF